MIQDKRLLPMLKAVACAVVLCAASCKNPAKDPAAMWKKANDAFESANYEEAARTYDLLAQIDPGFSSTARQMAAASRDRIAANEVGRTGKYKIPEAAKPDAGAEVSTATGTEAKKEQFKVKMCEPTWRKRIEDAEADLAPLETVMKEIAPRIAAVESKYQVKPAPDGGWDFLLPAGTSKEDAVSFWETTAKTYANDKAEEAAAKAETAQIRAKISAIEAEASRAGVIRDCLYPPSQEF
jgi:hypothetical protein